MKREEKIATLEAMGIIPAAPAPAAAAEEAPPAPAVPSFDGGAYLAQPAPVLTHDQTIALLFARVGPTRA